MANYVKLKTFSLRCSVCTEFNTRFSGRGNTISHACFLSLNIIFFAFSVTSHLIQTQFWETYSCSSSSYAINPSQNFRKKNLILGKDISYLKKSEKVQPTAKFTSFVCAMQRQCVHYFLLYCLLFFYSYQQRSCEKHSLNDS